MRLTLRLTSQQRNTPGQQASISFDRCGGSIGRSRQADWYLPDPERILSSQHAVIEYREGAYFIADTSTNGLYLNGEPSPLGRGHVARLQAGDIVTLGAYVAEVLMEPSASAPSQPVNPVASPAVAPIQHPAEAEVDPLDLLIQQLAGAKPMPSAQMAFDDQEPAAATPPVMASNAAIPNDWDVEAWVEGAAVAEPEPLPSSAQPTPDILPSSLQSDFLAESAVSPSQAAPAVAPIPVKQATGTPPSTAEAQINIANNDAMEAFFRGLGLDSANVTPDRLEEFMEGAGQALREAIAGMLDALRTRTIIKNEIQASQTMIRSGENNPLKLSVSVDDAIFNLFAKKVRGFLPPIDAIHEALHDIKAHPVGLMAGTEAVIAAIMDHLHPDQVANQSDRVSLFDKMAQGGAAARWKAYQDRHQALSKDIEAANHIVFAQRFAAAYENQMDELKREAMRQYYQQPLFDK